MFIDIKLKISEKMHTVQKKCSLKRPELQSTKYSVTATVMQIWSPLKTVLLKNVRYYHTLLPHQAKAIPSITDKCHGRERIDKIQVLEDLHSS